ncbi:MAG: hypothetical protein Q8P91_02110 [bacterium]|nr:hypothetical protein [bacterium]
MKKDIRHKQILKRKNFFPTLLITVLLWLLLAGLVFFVDPEDFFVIPTFFFVFFLAFLFSFSIIFSNTRRGLVAALGLILFLILRFFGVGNILNLILIIAILVCFELYFSRFQQ